MSNETRFVVIRSDNGEHLREATAREIADFWHYQLDSRACDTSYGRCFARCVRINGTESVDIYTGPGASHTPGRFIGKDGDK